MRTNLPLRRGIAAMKRSDWFFILLSAAIVTIAAVGVATEYQKPQAGSFCAHCHRRANIRHAKPRHNWAEEENRMTTTDEDLATLPRSREEARARGFDRFYTGVPCKHGHLAARYVSTTNCAACQVEHARRNGGWGARPSKQEYFTQARDLVAVRRRHAPFHEVRPCEKQAACPLRSRPQV